MGATDKKDIVIVMLQYSVVIKGIERKLTDMGYNTTIITDNAQQEILRIGDNAALVIVYLPPDINEAHYKLKVLHGICQTVENIEQKMLLIGESKYKANLLEEIPGFRKYTWLDRPVDPETLEKTVNKEIERKEVIERKHRILVVDDDPAYAKIVREWIKDEYRVDIVTAGMQAITFLLKTPEDDRVDLILLDYEMPVVDGPQVLQMLRQEEATAHIPVIFLTGNGTREAVSRVMELKPDGYLLKTAKKADLLGLLAGRFKKG